jgi:hypothetical protein
VGPALIDGASARVPVSLSGQGGARQVQVVLRNQNGQWRIDDLEYGDKRSLRAILAQPNR